jgi:hypothetical protein
MSHKNKKVKQYNKTGVFIAAFESIKQAAEKTGFNYYSISKVCNFRQDFVEGFRFEFDDER